MIPDKGILRQGGARWYAPRCTLIGIRWVILVKLIIDVSGSGGPPQSGERSDMDRQQPRLASIFMNDGPPWPAEMSMKITHISSRFGRFRASV